MKCTLHCISIKYISTLSYCLQADYDDVCEFSLDIFKRKFEYFRKNMSKMEELFSSKFETVADVGKKMSRCVCVLGENTDMCMCVYTCTCVSCRPCSSLLSLGNSQRIK